MSAEEKINQAKVWQSKKDSVNWLASENRKEGAAGKSSF